MPIKKQVKAFSTTTILTLLGLKANFIHLCIIEDDEDEEITALPPAEVTLEEKGDQGDHQEEGSCI